jgi:pimeloyl-ACP methyl ester carboxylesterase
VQRRWLARELGDLRLDENAMLERSPIRHARKLSHVPLLIGHGSNDDRCPVEQSRRLVAELNGHHRYLEDRAGAHPPSDWQAWAAAVVAHFALARTGASPGVRHMPGVIAGHGDGASAAHSASVTAVGEEPRHA